MKNSGIGIVCAILIGIFFMPIYIFFGINAFYWTMELIFILIPLFIILEYLYSDKIDDWFNQP